MEKKQLNKVERVADICTRILDAFRPGDKSVDVMEALTVVLAEVIVKEIRPEYIPDTIDCVCKQLLNDVAIFIKETT